MKFVDSCQVSVVAGKGGNGAVAFRREKFVPFGGPSGGDGGNGGDVYFVTDPGLSTLLDLTYAHTIKAEDGRHGMGSDCYGRAGKDTVCRVPVGTQVFDAATNELLFDLALPDTKTLIARGGKGGRGNMHFATAEDRAPRRADPGDEGQARALRLELKVMADVGLLGFPNVGKSTFIRACSRARPKVADYPFTTLVPHLGVVSVDEDTHFVVADIPGLIPGASEGAGLGIQFLKHVERTRALLHLVTVSYEEGRDPVSDFDALMHELRAFDPKLASRPMIAAVSKADLPDAREAHAKLRGAFAKRGVDLRLVSAATGEGVKELVRDLHRLLTAPPKPDAEHGPKAKTIADRAPTAKTKASQKKVAKKTAATKKTVPEKATAKKSSAAQSPAKKKAPVDRTAAKKAHAKKTPATKTPATKAAASKKVAPKRASAKKNAASKKVVVKKNAPKAKRPPVRKPATKSRRRTK
ncbi:MAG: GTPase ObgE [Polyangiaceae bacterium]